jgi:ABC-type spermidine/putrescine transport system permease subunit II
MVTRTFTGNSWLYNLTNKKDLLWLTIWIAGLGVLWIWDALFLNAPAFARLQTAFLNSLLTGLMVVLFSLALGWFLGVSLNTLEHSKSKVGFAILSFVTFFGPFRRLSQY